jgi:hypothetical protein
LNEIDSPSSQTSLLNGNNGMQNTVNPNNIRGTNSNISSNSSNANNNTNSNTGINGVNGIAHVNGKTISNVDRSKKKFLQNNNAESRQTEEEERELIGVNLLSKFIDPMNLRKDMKTIELNRIRVSLQFRSNTAASSLTFMNLRGILSYPKYAELMLKKIGLGIDDLDNKTDIWTTEELKFLATKHNEKLDPIKKQDESEQ